MLLFLKYAIAESGCDEHMFFRVAYYWRFGKMLYSDTDALQYRLHAVVPRYVEDYVHHLQEKQNQCKNIATSAESLQMPLLGTSSHL